MLKAAWIIANRQETLKHGVSARQHNVCLEVLKFDEDAVDGLGSDINAQVRIKNFCL